MSRYNSYINSAKLILQQYNGKEPFASFLKKYFAASKKYGSKDRKQISQLCYSFFRLGKAGENLSSEEEILTALFLCSNESNEILAELKPKWNEKARLPLKEKLSSLNYPLSSVFPWKEELSNGIDYEKFCESFFTQPALFLRLRPGKEKMVRQKLQQAGSEFETLSDTCLTLPNASKIDLIIELDKEAVIQDYNSQHVGDFFPVREGRSDRVWDCCAASGGKSIMAYDINPGIQLTVSDIRESILVNLRKRFRRAGIKKYKSYVIDLGKSNVQHPVAIGSRINNKHTIIIADVPCTGSGTWSRTPEQLYFFDEKKIGEYSSLQKKIVSNVIPQLEQGGSLVYITCSVFKKENEEIVDFIRQNFPLQLKKAEVLKGYDKKADSMFVAVLNQAKH